MTNSKQFDFTKNPMMDFFKNFQDQNFMSQGNMWNANNGNFDVNNLVANQRRNAETISNLNQVLTEGFQAIIRNQAENFQKTTADMFQMMKEQSSGKTPEEQAAQSLHTTKHCVDSAFKNTKEFVQMASKLNMEVLEICGKTLSENLGDCCKVASKRKAA